MLHPTFLFFIFPFAFTWGIFGLLFIPYFLPTIIALIRRNASTGGIFALNFFLGWTFIGWIISLVWAISGRTSGTTIIVNNTYPAGNAQSYPPPPTYSQPPYNNQPPYTQPPYNPEPTRPAQQTAPTLRRTSPNPPTGQDTQGR